MRRWGCWIGIRRARLFQKGRVLAQDAVLRWTVQEPLGLDRIALPGNTSSTVSESLTTNVPPTSTCMMPAEGTSPFSYVERSMTVSGSKSVRSASVPT